MTTEAVVRCGPKCMWAGRSVTIVGLGTAIWVLAEAYSRGNVSQNYFYAGLNGASVAAGALLMVFLRRHDAGPQDKAPQTPHPDPRNRY